MLMLLLCHVSGALGQNAELIDLAEAYFTRGDMEKAGELYGKLSSKKQNIPHIHSRYVEILKTSEEGSHVSNYIRKVRKHYQDQWSYQVDLVNVTHLRGMDKWKTELMQGLENTYRGRSADLRDISLKLSELQLYDEALVLLRAGRTQSGDQGLFSLEIASIHRLKKNFDYMMDEYLIYSLRSPTNLNYIKHRFDLFFPEEQDLALLENSLNRKAQEYSDEPAFLDFLLWVKLRKKDYRGAYRQAQALDLRTGSFRSLEVARNAQKGEDFDSALFILDSILEIHKQLQGLSADRFLQVRKLRLEFLQQQYGFRKIRDYDLNYDLVREFVLLSAEYYPSAQAFYCLFHAAEIFHRPLNEPDSGKYYLSKIIDSPRASRDSRLRSKLLMADILMKEENPWEASLLYNQVSRSGHSSLLSDEAKLKNARLLYYTGNFELAKGQLNVLKKSVSKYISNDALMLSNLINSNGTRGQGSESALESFAKAELFLFQDKLEDARFLLDSLISSQPTHPITDDAWYLLSRLETRAGRHDEALLCLAKVKSTGKDSYLLDEAFFDEALLREGSLSDMPGAIQCYREFLELFPESIYRNRARNRLDILLNSQRGSPQKM